MASLRVDSIFLNGKGRSFLFVMALLLLILVALLFFPSRTAKERVPSETKSTEKEELRGESDLKTLLGTDPLGRPFTNVNDRVDVGDRTSLMWAAMYNDVEKAEILIENGADVNLSDFQGQTALMYVAVRGDKATNLAKLLLAHGASINAQDRNSDTALDFAKGTDQPHDDMVNLLKQAGATSRWDNITNQ